MISILRSAKDIDFCGNGLRFGVKSTNAYSAAGSVAELTIVVNSAVVAGNEFSFVFGDKIVKFTTAAVNDYSGEIFIAGSLVDGIVTGLNANYLIQKYYKISSIANNIVLTAKEKGSIYSLSLITNNTNIVLFNNTPGTDKTLRSSYKTLCEVYLEKDRVSNTFDLVATSLHAVDGNGECNVMPGQLLSKYFNDTDLPTYNQQAIKKVSKTAKRFYIKLAEMFEGSVKSVVTSSSLYAIDGKINSDLFSDSFDFITAAAVDKNYLLDPSVLKIETWLDAQQFLYFVNYTAAAAFTQKVKIYYTDGSNITVSKGSISNATIGDCYIVVCGFNQLSLHAASTPDKEAYKYEVWLENAGVLCGKPMTYYLVQKPLFAREFWYKNSMGGMEAVLCEKQIHKLDIKRSELVSNSSYATDIDEINDSYECITGNKTLKEIEHLAEFVSSKKTYLLQKGSAYEVAIEQGNYTLADDYEDLYNFKFKYRIGKKYEVVTAQQVVVVIGGIIPVIANKVIVFHRI